MARYFDKTRVLCSIHRTKCYEGVQVKNLRKNVINTVNDLGPITTIYYLFFLFNIFGIYFLTIKDMQ
jgi:surface polysaccharide O-acyltransferase-like enzyme